MTLSDIRRLTPVAQNCAYFQTSGFAPKLEPVTEEMVRLIRFQNQGPALPWVGEKMAQVLEHTRSRVAQAMNAAPEEIMLNENATTGINVVANGIEWQSGDNVILSTHEHPGNRIPWYNLAKLRGVQLRFVDVTEDDARMLDQLDRLLDARTRLVSVSHVSRQTGLRFPARAIVEAAHRRDVPVLFDGAQAFGAVPVDVQALGCDFYAFSGHKYIMGPQGTGGLYVRRDRIDWLRPSWIGSHSQKDMDSVGNMTLHDAAKRFEFGTRNVVDQAGLGKALEIWKAIGWDVVFGQIKAYTDRMKTALQTVPGLVLETPLPYEKSSGIVTFHIPGFESPSLLTSLWEHERIVASPVESDSPSIRVSTHVFNTDEECARLVAGLVRVRRDGY